MAANRIDNFPAAPGLPANSSAYLAQVDERYVADAYNSLSIEGYQVTDELIERVTRGDWNPGPDSDQERDKDALAARGYYQAFNAVRMSIVRIVEGENPGHATALGWLWLVDGISPTWTDVVGVALALCGAGVIAMGQRQI